MRPWMGALLASFFALGCGPASYLTPGVPGNPSLKRGIAGLSSQADLDALKGRLAWWYNWGPSPGGLPSSDGGMDFVPMSWNGNNAAQGQAVDAYLTGHPECRYLLVLNEPNLRDQANLTVAQAVDLWPQFEALAQRHGVKLVGPALNWGTVNTAANPANPIAWLDAFFAQFRQKWGREPQVDALAFHWYDYGLEDWLTNGAKLPKYGKKVWVTEFANWHTAQDGAQIDSVAKQKQQMQKWVALMESSSLVERYAWFTGRVAGNPCYLNLFDAAPGQLSDLGQYYLDLPGAP